jgi:hypothetical protein
MFVDIQNIYGYFWELHAAKKQGRNCVVVAEPGRLNRPPPMQFLYVKIPIAQGGLDQFYRLEDKIDQILIEHGVGSVLGWGDSLGDPRPDGSRPVAYMRIDVDVANIVLARALLLTSLPTLGAPTGTEIHYTIERQHMQDIYSESRWLPNDADN